MAFIRWMIVVLSVVFLTTIAINAADTIDTPGSSLIGAAIGALDAPPCPEDMVLVSMSGGDVCVDRYEASTSDTCPNQDPMSKRETDENLSLDSCTPQSAANQTPWRNISRQQAELACARVGKRLPSNSEWYRASLGTPDKNIGWGKEDCNVNTTAEVPDSTGSRANCRSASGAYDMVGNVWEWLEETVVEDRYIDTAFPDEGYVTNIDARGIPIGTDATNPDDAFFRDYFWLEGETVRGMLRGGYWRSKSDAGQYALNVTVPPSFVGTAVGFRCVKDAN